MKLDEFVTCNIDLLYRFREQWITYHSTNPDAYPLDLDSAEEWFDTFVYWAERSTKFFCVGEQHKDIKKEDSDETF